MRVRLLAAVLASGVVLVGCGQDPAPSGRLEGAALVDALRAGGYVLLLRHTETARGGVDSLETLDDCAAQRPLSQAGREQAREIGRAITALDIPVERVVASPFCRTVETAELAFGATDTDSALLALASVGDDGSPPQERALEAARALASEPPAAGTDTVLVGHVSTIGPLTGTSPEEGGTIVVLPDGEGGFDVVGEIEPGGFGELAAAD